MADHDEIDDYFMHFKDHRLKTFKNWPFEDGSCCAEKVLQNVSNIQFSTVTLLCVWV